MTKNWQEIDRLLTEEYQNQWKSQGFTYEQTFHWIRNVKLTVAEADLASYLKNIKGQDFDYILNHSQLAELREEYREWKITKQLENLNAPTHQPSAFAWKPLLITALLAGLTFYLLTK